MANNFSTVHYFREIKTGTQMANHITHTQSERRENTTLLACLLPSVRVVLVYLVQGPIPRDWWSSLWAESVNSQDDLPQICPQANLLLIIP